jgi:hypothetical protein
LLLEYREGRGRMAIGHLLACPAGAEAASTKDDESVVVEPVIPFTVHS